MLTFANELQLTILFKSKHIFIDGTFSVCPPFFDQVFTIHGVHHEHSEFSFYSFVHVCEISLLVVVPCVIALLPGRSATIYKQLFQLLDEQATDLKMTFEPEVITSDFETGLIKTIKQHVTTFFYPSYLIYISLSLYFLKFPMGRHVGCFFHYTQSIHRKIQKLGLSTIYKDDEKARSICQQLMALALLPLDKVELAFQSLAANHPESLDDLFEYFETFWMETTSIDLWNVFELKTRTNNNAEGNCSCTSPLRHSSIGLLGWHNRFAHRIDKKHPNIWHFIRVLQEEEVRFNQYVQHVRMGKKKVYGKRTCRMHECLKTLADRFKKQQIDLTDYIQGLSLLVAKKK